MNITKNLKKLPQKYIFVFLILELLIIGLFLFNNHVAYDSYYGCYIVKSFSGYTYEIYDDHVVVRDCTKKNAHLTIPDTYLGKPVTIIGPRAFIYLPIEEVTLGKNIISIENDAFCSCTKLKSVTGKAQLQNISSGCFMNCTQLETLSIGNSLKCVGDQAFWNCTKLKSQYDDFISQQTNLYLIGTNAFDFDGSFMTLEGDDLNE